MKTSCQVKEAHDEWPCGVGLHLHEMSTMDKSVWFQGPGVGWRLSANGCGFLSDDENVLEETEGGGVETL